MTKEEQQDYEDKMRAEFYCLSCEALTPMDCYCDEHDDENEFYPCADCDLPDACADFGCAIANGVKRPDIF